MMHATNSMKLYFGSLVVAATVALGACGSGAKDGKGAGPAGEIPIIAATGAAVPFQLGDNPYGAMGGAFLAKANLGSSTVLLDTTHASEICLKGTVEMVPTPADGSHPPYSDYWGVELGFNLNQGADAVKNPWTVPDGVVGFWFTVAGPTIPPLRFKTTPTGRDPALEQDSCALVNPASGEATTVLFTNMYVQCWAGAQGTGTTDISQGLLEIGLQVAAATGTAFPIDFCVTHLGVVTN